MSAPFVDEALNYCDQSEDNGVQGEEDIVGLHLDDAKRVFVVVIAPNARIVIQTKRVDGVTTETRQIESDKIEIQTDDGFAFEIDPALRVEGDGPGHEVDPANHGAECLCKGRHLLRIELQITF